MKFTSLTLQSWLYDALKANNFFELTEVQEKTFKLINQSRNVTISAPTGSGKTLAYLLPILNNIDLLNKHIQYVIVAPTKELVWQTYHNVLALTKFNSNIKIVLLDNNQKVENLVKNPAQIIIGTVEKVRQAISSGVRFDNLKTIVLDEADMLIDYGFVNQINDMFSKLKAFRNNVQKVFCSASIHNTVASTFNKVVGNIVNVQLAKNIYTNSKINHSIVYTKDNEKPLDTLKQLLKVINPYICIIFANTKQDVEKIYGYMLDSGYSVAMLHKGMETRDRKQVFNRLNNNEFKYLVATDLASRGLDIDGVSDVISFGLPKEDIWYLHRSGRTGRGKYFGNSYIIYDNQYDKNISRLSRKINLVYYLLANNKLIEKKKIIRPQKQIVDVSMKKEISKLYNAKALKVKPGYKKKIKNKIFKLQQKAKREYLDKKYSALKLEQWKKESARKSHKRGRR